MNLEPFFFSIPRVYIFLFAIHQGQTREPILKYLLYILYHERRRQDGTIF